MRPYLIILLICINIRCFSQHNSISNILQNNLHKQPSYTTKHAINEQLFLVNSVFGKPEISITAGAPDPSTIQITAVDLVFTDFPSNDALIKLNTARLKNLFEKYPKLSTDPSIEWKLVRQTDGTERDSAVNLFHGFVIYYKPRQSAEVMKTDIAKMKDMLEPVVPDEAVKRRRGFVTGDTTELRKNYEIEDYNTVKKMPMIDALHYLGIDEREKITYKKYDSLFVYEKPWLDSSGVSIEMKKPEDSTVLKVLDRMQ